MESIQFKAPSKKEVEATIVKVDVIADKGFAQIVARETKTGDLLTGVASIKALGIKAAKRGTRVLLVGESRIAGVTTFIDDTKAIMTHKTTDFAISQFINLEDEGEDVDFDALFASPSQKAAQEPTSQKVESTK